MRFFYLVGGGRKQVKSSDYKRLVGSQQASAKKSGRKGASQSTLKKKFLEDEKKKGPGGGGHPTEWESGYYHIRNADDNGRFIHAIYDAARIVHAEDRTHTIEIYAIAQFDDGSSQDDIQYWTLRMTWSEQLQRWTASTENRRGFQRWIDSVLTMRRKLKAEDLAAVTLGGRYVTASGSSIFREYDLGDIKRILAKFHLFPVQAQTLKVPTAS